MVQYINSKELATVTEFNIDITSWLNFTTIAASANPKDFNLPTGPVIDGKKGAAISEQMEIDYESFIESIQKLITEYYNFEITSESHSDNYSHYYQLIAKRNDGSWILKFDVTFRISNHRAHRTPEQQKRKAEFEQNLRIPKGMGIKSLTSVDIVVNNQKYNDYDEAFLDIDAALEKKNEIMRRSEKYKR